VKPPEFKILKYARQKEEPIMKFIIRSSIIAVALLGTVFLTTAAHAQSGFTWQDAASGESAPPNIGGTGTTETLGPGIAVYNDLASFQAAAPDATSAEDLEDNLVPAMNVGSCAEPVSAASNDACFTPGQFVDGLEVTSSSGGGIVLLEAGFAGVPSAVMGANTFADTTSMTFPNGATQAVAMEIYAGAAPGDVMLTLFDTGGVSLGSTTVVGLGGLPDGDFIGLVSDTPIGEIVIEGLGDNGELFDDVLFNDAVGGDVARFAVSKDFDDNNTASVEVTLSCNTGLPLEQTTTIEENAPVNFVIGDFEQGELNCTVTEAPVDGYTASYNDGVGVSADNCSWENLTGRQFTCIISNDLQPSPVEVTKEWVDENPGFNPFNVADAVYRCTNHALDDDGIVEGNLDFYTEGSSDTVTFPVLPDWDTGTNCSIVEVNLPDGGVEVDDSNCQNIRLFPGDSASCTIVNTRLYEGIPTLSQYGLAVLALLMLGMGFVGFRRFV